MCHGFNKSGVLRVAIIGYKRGDIQNYRAQKRKYKKKNCVANKNSKTFFVLFANVQRHTHGRKQKEKSCTNKKKKTKITKLHQKHFVKRKKNTTHNNNTQNDIHSQIQ